MGDLNSFDWKSARAQVYHETMWGCRGGYTFYPPMCWLDEKKD